MKSCCNEMSCTMAYGASTEKINDEEYTVTFTALKSRPLILKLGF